MGVPFRGAGQVSATVVCPVLGVFRRSGSRFGAPFFYQDIRERLRGFEGRLPLRHSHTVTVFLAVTPALAAGFALGRLSAPKSEAPGANLLSPCPVTRVVDGDTIRVLYRGRDESLRLLRIDTPERGEPGFEEATTALRGLVGGREVVLEFETPGVEERDRYGRLLAYVFAGGVNVNVEMVRLGHSRFWTKYGRGRYACDFEAAKREPPPATGG